MAKNPQSHLARCLRSRYHPRSPFLEANIGHRPSFAWRSICEGKNVLLKGVLWQIRNGRSTRIWEDRWIPGSKNSNTPSPVLFDLQVPFYVRDLMTDAGGKWNITLLREHFPPETVKAIYQIPICRSPQEDQLRWIFTKDGRYSVKSGYWMTKNFKDACSSNPSSSSNNPNFWKWIWKCKIQPKIQVFLWKCLRGILPTKVNLINRKCPIDPICVRCGMDVETSEHCLRDCPWSIMFWRTCKLRIDGTTHMGICTQDWILHQIKGIKE